MSPNQQCHSTDRKKYQIPRTCSLQAHVGYSSLILDHYMLVVTLAEGCQASHWPSDASKQLTAENISSETANIPVLGLSSWEHSVISLSASVFISTELTPMYTQDTTFFTTIHHTLGWTQLEQQKQNKPETKSGIHKHLWMVTLLWNYIRSKCATLLNVRCYKTV